MIPPAGPEAPEDRRTDLRLAHVHLRMGSLELARAELESFAGRGELDRQALLDLAEARWRTGDLPGAGVAASAYLGTDDQQVLALVIAAEAAAAVGHPGDARRLAQEALDLLDVAAREQADAPSGAEALDTIFAGMPQSGVWPLRPHFRVEPTGLLFVTPAATTRQAPEPAPAVGASDGAAMDGGSGAGPGSADATAVAAGVAAAAGRQTPDAGALGPGFWSEPAEPAPTAAPVELSEAREALEAGDPAVAAARLGDLLRRRPDLAGSVLAALGDDTGPAEGASSSADHADSGSDPTTVATGPDADQRSASDGLSPRHSLEQEDP